MHFFWFLILSIVGQSSLIKNYSHFNQFSKTASSGSARDIADRYISSSVDITSLNSTSVNTTLENSTSVDTSSSKNNSVHIISANNSMDTTSAKNNSVDSTLEDKTLNETIIISIDSENSTANSSYESPVPESRSNCSGNQENERPVLELSSSSPQSVAAVNEFRWRVFKSIVSDVSVSQKTTSNSMEVSIASQNGSEFEVSPKLLRVRRQAKANEEVSSDRTTKIALKIILTVLLVCLLLIAFLLTVTFFRLRKSNFCFIFN